MRNCKLSCTATPIGPQPIGRSLAGLTLTGLTLTGLALTDLVLIGPFLVSAFLMLLGCAPAAGQAANTPAVTESPRTGIGYSYQLPPQWAVVTVAPPPAPVSTPAPLVPKKGTACISVPNTARRGNPASVIVIVELPFDCYGATMTSQDLASFGAGVADGLKETFDLADPILGGYTLGSHSVWIERARGNPKGKTPPQPKAEPPYPYTVEIACSLLTKAAVCWMTTAADEASLHDFEAIPVELDTDAATPLVPSTAFDKPPVAP